MHTSWDIARAAGVSQATVSRVINNRGYVADATREKVLAAIEAHAYSPNAMAKGLVTRRSRLIGVMVADVTNPFYPELIEELDARLGEAGLQMILANDGGRRDEAEAVRRLEEQRVAGIVFISARLGSPSVKRLVGDGFPVVLVNRYVDGVECDTVIGDNAAGMARIAEHLRALGHTRIALISGTRDASTSRDRVAAFAGGDAAGAGGDAAGAGGDAAAAGGDAAGAGGDAPPAARAHTRASSPRPEVVAGDFTFEGARAAALALLRRPPADRPTAIATVNDLTALAVLNVADELGLRVPGDLSVTGYDDIPMAGWPRFALTTIRQPLAPMAARAAELLQQRIDAPDAPPRRVVFPAELIERGSTGPPPTQ